MKRDRIFELGHESMITNPKNVLSDLCTFLGVVAPEDYFNDCASIVFQSPHGTRYNAPWTSELINVVRGRMTQFPFLEGCSHLG
jgi:hypothetical protein